MSLTKRWLDEINANKPNPDEEMAWYAADNDAPADDGFTGEEFAELMALIDADQKGG